MCRDKNVKLNLKTSIESSDAKKNIFGPALHLFYILWFIEYMIFLLVAAGEGLTRSAVAELLKKLDSHEEELGKTA